jgi:hypothetical protein
MLLRKKRFFMDWMIASLGEGLLCLIYFGFFNRLQKKQDSLKIIDNSLTKDS